MKKQGLLYASLIFSAIFLVSYVLYPTGSPGGRTGSPGDNGATCTGCHSGSNQQVSGWITSNIPSSGYVAGQTYTITATATHSGAAKYGFEITCESTSNDAKTGTFVITDPSQTTKVNSNKAVTHTSNGTNPSGGAKTWMFDWTAPAEGTGNVKFYGAFNAANGNNETSGDVIYTSTLTVFEATSGITDNLAGSVNIKTYPNPFQDHLIIDMENTDQTPGSVMVTGSDGRILWNSEFHDDIPGIINIETSKFPKGIYLITVNFKDQTKTSYKVIKN